jgi:hypothetical protein
VCRSELKSRLRTAQGGHLTCIFERRERNTAFGNWLEELSRSERQRRGSKGSEGGAEQNAST